MNVRSLIASSLGNTVEWLDFGLFIYFAPIIGENFFPTYNAHSATIAAFGVFAAGFICRPLGGIIFGRMGDHQGRVKTLRYSIFMITLATFLVGFLPTYKEIGIIASILFTLLRLLQGISIGGEYSGVMIYLAESSPEKKRGTFTSFAAVGANLGFLFATIIVAVLDHVLTQKNLYSWGWRLPFILAGIWGFLILYWRMKLNETLAYQLLKKSHHIVRQPLLTAFRVAPKSMLKVLGLTCMGATFYYVFFGFMPNYLSQEFGIKLHAAFDIQSISLFLMLFLVPVAGVLGDRFGRKKMLLITALGMVFLSLPGFYLLHSKTIFSIWIMMITATLLSSLEQGNSLTTIVEISPLEVRYSSIAFSYNLGNAIFGGGAPLIVSILATYNLYAPAYYLITMAFISLLVILSLKGKKHVSLLEGMQLNSRESLEKSTFIQSP